MTFADFLATAWDDHAEHPREVADRLAGSLHLITSAEDAPAFARIVTHVYGEHLAAWNEGVALLASLAERPVCVDDRDARAMIARSTATLRHGNRDAHALDGLPTDDLVWALATAASALAAQGQWPRALADFEAALACVPPGLDPVSAAPRALAVAGNNLAVALEEKPDRSAAETVVMVLAARVGVTYWTLAGTWLEAERAHYRLARSLLQAGDMVAARESAARCAAICAEHDAPAMERFLAECVVAISARCAGDDAAFAAARERARDWHARVAAEEAPWCATDLAELEAVPQSEQARVIA
ncbi:MAG: hypothetical protein ABI920_09125 [Casimicrobiaceae bacterium]